jgi:hypothetical protein
MSSVTGPVTPSTSDLLIEIAAKLPNAATLSLTSPTQANDAYEQYLFTLVVRAAFDISANIRYETVHSWRPATRLVMRTSPGHIYSRLQAYTHAVLEWPNRDPLEAHVGIRLLGKSGVLHECDVAVIKRTEAVTCRSDNRDPKPSALIFAIVPDLPRGEARPG